MSNLYKYYEKQFNLSYWNFINDNLDKPWEWKYLTSNPNITMNIIEKNLDKNWNWKYISLNPNLTWEFLENNLNFLLTDLEECNSFWTYLTQHPNISRSSKKEIHYFDREFKRGDNWYKGHFVTKFTKFLASSGDILNSD